MDRYTEIPDDDHIAAYTKDRKLMMVDTRLREARRGIVWAKAFGACPLIVTARKAARDGMKVLGTVVGTYQARCA